jgi:pimeloyl-ACP methyl ester carboxylesterase
VQVNVEGIRLHVEDDGDGPPLLLLNGIGAHAGMWKPLQAALTGPRVIAFDMPGTGRSATPPIPLSMGALARLAEGVLDHLEIEQADVLGYSFGGVVAQRLARRSPERVRRLVLAATTPGWGGVPGSLQTLARMSTPLRYYWRSYYESIVGDLMGGRPRTDAEFVRRHGEERLANPPDPLGYAWQLAALAGDPGTLPWLHRLEQPTLVVAGDDDPVMPLANALLLAQRLPHARLFVAPGEGHLLLLDPQSRALPAIRDFVRGDEPEWGEAVGVSREMLDAGLRAASGEAHPLALMSAGVRAFWS